VSNYDGRFILVLRQTGADLYKLDDVRPEDLRDSLTRYRDKMDDGPVYPWDATGLHEISSEQGEFILRETRHSLDALNY
jgi:hypothetical protein